MSDNKQKHLDFIQNIVGRLANNSFVLKGWAITIVSALFAFSSDKETGHQLGLLMVSFIPILSFWILDGYFIWQERIFRALYSDVGKKAESDIDYQRWIQVINATFVGWLLIMFKNTSLGVL